VRNQSASIQSTRRNLIAVIILLAKKLAELRGSKPRDIRGTVSAFARRGDSPAACAVPRCVASASRDLVRVRLRFAGRTRHVPAPLKGSFGAGLARCGGDLRHGVGRSGGLHGDTHAARDHEGQSCNSQQFLSACHCGASSGGCSPVGEVLGGRDGAGRDQAHTGYRPSSLSALPRASSPDADRSSYTPDIRMYRRCWKVERVEALRQFCPSTTGRSRAVCDRYSSLRGLQAALCAPENHLKVVPTMMSRCTDESARTASSRQ